LSEKKNPLSRGDKSLSRGDKPLIDGKKSLSPGDKSMSRFGVKSPENLPQGSVRIKNRRINQLIIRDMIRFGGRRPVLANTAFRHPSGGKQADIWMIYFHTPPKF
jgi:hypothetical protein